MSDAIAGVVASIHASPTRLVLALTGGGSRALAWLLETPGASRTVLEAIVPYGERSLAEWLGGRPDQACCEATARGMAMRAFLRARRLEPSASDLAGVACTASLATDRPKRGPHRAHVAIQTGDRTAVKTLVLAKGLRPRSGEERTVAELAIEAIAEVCGVADRPARSLLPGEEIVAAERRAELPWRRLLLGEVDAIRQGGPDERPAALFPGAFNPLHVGHRRMLEVGEELLSCRVEPELAILNVEKPPLDYIEIARRVGQFDRPVWLTRLSTFDEKARHFGPTTFLVGVDTLRRIADPRYYGGRAEARDAAIARIVERGCRFLAFGRSDGARFVRLADLELPETLRRAATEAPEERFREDVSSTDLRR